MKESQRGREMCPIWLHLSSGCVFLCINVCQCMIVIKDVYTGDVRVMLHM